MLINLDIQVPQGSDHAWFFFFLCLLETCLWSHPISWFMMPWKCWFLSNLRVYFCLRPLSWHRDLYVYCFIDTLHRYLLDISNPICLQLSSWSSFVCGNGTSHLSKGRIHPPSCAGKKILRVILGSSIYLSSHIKYFIHSVFKYPKSEHSVPCLLLSPESEPLAFLI